MDPVDSYWRGKAAGMAPVEQCRYCWGQLAGHGGVRQVWLGAAGFQKGHKGFNRCVAGEYSKKSS